MADITTLRDAIGELVHDGDSVAVEGFTHLIPFAAGPRADSTEAAGPHAGPADARHHLRPDDRGGRAAKLVFSWAGNPGVGSLHRFRDAVERNWPAPLVLEEHSHAAMANRLVAGASGLPFAVMRGYLGTDLPSHTANVATVTCPFTGEELAAVSPSTRTSAIIHAQQADRKAT